MLSSIELPQLPGMPVDGEWEDVCRRAEADEAKKEGAFCDG